jgi:hypothetical protein
MVSMDKINIAVLLRSMYLFILHVQLMGKLIRRFSLDNIKASETFR